MDNKIEKKRVKKKRNWLLIVFLFLAGVSLAVISGLGFAIEWVSRYQANNYYSSLAAVSADFSEGFGDTQSNALIFQSINEALSEAVSKTYAESGAELDEGSETGERELKKTRHYTTSWLRLEGTVIDYPVMQGGDNEYYLHHLPDGKENKMGSIFLDYRNSPDFTDKHSVIYGHHMKSGDMFTTLKYYNGQAFYETNRIINLYTQSGNYDIELFTGYIVDANTESIPITFKNEEDFVNYIESIKKRSVFKSDVTVLPDDLIVSLVTCSYEFDNARMLVAGKLIPKPND